MESSFLCHVKERFKNDRPTSIVMIIYSILCVVSGIWWMIDFSLRNLIVSFVFIGFVFFIYWVEYFVKIRFGTVFVICSLCLAFGGILGACFDFYMLIPVFDDFLHTLSGVLFAGLGFGVGERIFGAADTKRKFTGCLVFALCFSLAIAVGWELFEYAGNVFLKGDNFEDTFVTDIYSYVLSGGHNELVVLNDIEQTVIHYGDGQVYTMDGYLDLGSIDTINDILVCTIGALVFYLTAMISYKHFPRFNEVFVPRTVEYKILKERKNIRSALFEEQNKNNCAADNNINTDKEIEKEENIENKETVIK